MRRIIYVKPWFIIGISLLSCFTLVAQPEAPPVRNIVLVHGAWADGSGWKGVYDILVKDGYKVGIVQEPETSFKEDVAATKRVIAQQDGPWVVVAHSYGGAVITEAGTIPRSWHWFTSPPTCRMLEKVRPRMGSAFQVI
jgi:pimeloyl-ACP methyl ester carboxylesterase